MADAFASFTPGLDSPGRSQFDADAAKSDTVDLANVTRGIYVGVGGDIKLILVGDTTAQTWKAVPQGSVLYLQVKRIYSTGTTATSLLGVY